MKKVHLTHYEVMHLDMALALLKKEYTKMAQLGIAEPEKMIQAIDEVNEIVDKLNVNESYKFYEEQQTTPYHADLI
jgi:hypothetical protein